MAFGELALNYADGIVYYKDAGGIIRPLQASGITYYTTDLSTDVVDCAVGQYFRTSVSGGATFSFTNVPAFPVNYSMTIEVYLSSGTLSWPAGVHWPGGVTPAPTTGKTSLFLFVTADGGSNWAAASVLNFDF